MLICAHQGVFLPFTFCPVANCLLPPNISQVSSGNFQIAWLLFRMSNLAFLYCSPMLSLGSTWLPSPRLFSTSAAPFPNQTFSLEDKYMQELHKVTSQIICKACWVIELMIRHSIKDFKGQKKMFFLHVWLHVLFSWLFLPQNTLKKKKSLKMLSSQFLTTTLFLLGNNHRIVSLLLCGECAQPWPRQRRDHIREATLLAAGWGAGSVVGSPSSPSGASFPSPFFSTSWGCGAISSPFPHPFPTPGDPMNGLSCSWPCSWPLFPWIRGPCAPSRNPRAKEI